jgi:putative thiamine transport system permease protein
MEKAHGNVLEVEATNSFLRHTGVHAEINGIVSLLNAIVDDEARPSSLTTTRTTTTTTATGTAVRLVVSFSPCVACAEVIAMLASALGATRVDVDYDAAYDDGGVETLQEHGIAAAQLQRPDLARRLAMELRVAQSLGYSARSAWWRLAWPQLLAKLRAPQLAVLVYSLTVVDVALLIGPNTPPTLAVLAWQWLQAADAPRNAMGAAAAWLLTGTVVAVTGGGLLAKWCAEGCLAALQTRGVVAAVWSVDQPPTRDARLGLGWGLAMAQLLGRNMRRAGAAALLRSLPVAYAAIAFALALGSVIGVWPFPGLWPQAWTGQAWQAVAGSADVVWTTLGLALASSAASLLWAVAWLECAPPTWQQRLNRVVYLPLALPAVLWAIGLHRLALAWAVDAKFAGLWLAHTLCVVPYVLVSLQGPYRGFDARLPAVAASLGRSPWAFVWQIKWPLLRAALTASFAVGFSVSVAQYLPTLYVGAGRFNTITTEAVALAASGDRSLMAAFAALQWLLPALVFGLAAWLGQLLPHQCCTTRRPRARCPPTAATSSLRQPQQTWLCCCWA